ncbi:rhodanese-like domain-containing protein [Prescottella defluvii]
MALLSRSVGIFRKSYGTVDVHRAQDLVEQGAVLLDVRSRPEWDAGHAPGATHLPLHEVIDHGIEVVAGRPVVVICRSGGRSANAARQLSRLGAETYLVRGGIDAWRRAGLAITTPD